jgi:hypothetical protein
MRCTPLTFTSSSETALLASNASFALATSSTVWTACPDVVEVPQCMLTLRLNPMVRCISTAYCGVQWMDAVRQGANEFPARGREVNVL